MQNMSGARSRLGQMLAVLGPLVLAVVIVSSGTWLLHRHDSDWMMDLGVYRMGGAAVLTGDGKVYSASTSIGLQFTYTPFAALLFAPLSLLELPVQGALAIVLSVVSFALSIFIVLGHVWPAATPVRRALVTSLIVLAGLFFVPLSVEMRFGQTNSLIMLCAVVAFHQAARRPYLAVLLGFAASLKLTPLLLVLVLLLGKRVRAAIWAGGAFLVTVVIGFAALPRESADYWFRLFYDSERVGPTLPVFNQSVRSVIARALGSEHVPGWWVLVSLVILAIGVTLSVSQLRRGLVMPALVSGALTGVLASPISWEMHYMWFALATVFAGAAALRRRRVVDWAVSAVLGVAWFVPVFNIGLPDWAIEGVGLAPWQYAQAAGYPLAAVIFLLWAALSSGLGTPTSAEAREQMEGETALTGLKTILRGLRVASPAR
jgi:alpha-1,2-mannosyltransferase